MRKILNYIVINKETIQPEAVVAIKNDDGTVNVLEKITLESTVPQEWQNKYSAEERERIRNVNTVMFKHGMDILTEEEADFMLDPNGAKAWIEKIEKEIEDPVKLQELSGFRVEKKIIPLK
jgi:hypothetical protein